MVPMRLALYDCILLSSFDFTRPTQRASSQHHKFKSIQKRRTPKKNVSVENL